MKKEFTFRESDHTYWYGDERLPSVTEIMAPLYDFSHVSPELLSTAADFGTAVHKAIKLWIDGRLDFDALDVALKKPLEGFNRWFNDGQCGAGLGEMECCEQPLRHDRLKYSGTPDLVFEYGIVDIKTRPYNAITDPIQLAGYAGLVVGACLKRYVLFIDLEGNVKLTNGYKAQAGAIFRKLLDKWKMDKAVTDLIKNLKGEK